MNPRIEWAAPSGPPAPSSAASFAQMIATSATVPLVIHILVPDST
jgi:hypothetical protein